MAGSEKWSVTYTKHIKQKRKVYQDGFLELDASSQKVILYDDCETILHSRFVKKDDVIKSGETLVFDSYLVDIGDPHGDQKPLPNCNTKVTVASKSFQSPKLGIDTASVNRKPKLSVGKSRLRNLSPSQKIIREFKTSEMNKYGSSPACSDTTKSSKMEWQVLYTTQRTQKAKKYHDGILQLLIYGSQKQILLYDANRRLLDSRFLKKDEIITSGESITLDGHLVDVGECEGDNKPFTGLNLEGRNYNLDGKVKAQDESIFSQDKFPVEWEAMYTTQVTQKAKKYSNGILKLAMLGSYQMQVILLAEDGTILGRRYLQSSERIRTGSTLQLQNYLVELGDLRASCKGEFVNTGLSWKPTDSADRYPRLDNTKLSQRVLINKPISDERPKEASSIKHLNSRTQSSIDKHNISGLAVSKNPVRAAQDILSILKRPMTEKDATEMKKKSIDGSHASQASNVYAFDTGNLIEHQPLHDFCPEGSTVVDLNEENNKIHKHMRLGCISGDMVDTGSANRNASAPDPPTVEPKVSVALEVDLKPQQPIASVLQDPSTDILEKGYCNEPVSCEEDPIEGISTTSGITIPFVEEVTSENINQPFAGVKEIDEGWDNGDKVIVTEKSNGCTSHDFYDDGTNSKIAEQDNSEREADDFPSFNLGF